MVDRLPNRVRVDETVFAVTDGENEYRLMWEGSRDGEAVITHEKNINIVNESIDKMKHLWEFKSSPTSTNRKTIKENDDVFFKMMNKVRGKESLNEAVDVDAKANKSTIKKLAKECTHEQLADITQYLEKQDNLPQSRTTLPPLPENKKRTRKKRHVRNEISKDSNYKNEGSSRSGRM